MPETKGLEERLRAFARAANDECNVNYADAMGEAADAIERLTREKRELEQKLVFATDQTERALAMVTIAEASLSAAQAEIAELKAGLEPFAKSDDCSRLMYGTCRTRRCLKRAGWVPGSDIENGTCPHFKARSLIGGTDG